MTAARITLLALLLSGVVSHAATADPLLVDFAYPHAVQRYEFNSQGQALTVTFEELGHSPQVQDPARFNKALLESLARLQ